MCCIISDEPIEDVRGRYRIRLQGNLFQVNMMNAPCVDCPYSFCWCIGQAIPATGGCTQYALRRKALEYDMTKYSCFQGYFDVCCCIKAGQCGEQSCPEVCLFAEACFCNCFAISATRIYVMEKYDLQSDPCDYRLIRINNCLQLLSCVCDIAAIFIQGIRDLARLIDHIADAFYHTITGCMTAQVAHELNYQGDIKNNLVSAEVANSVPPYTAK